MVNPTRYRTLDRLAKDPRITEIRDEGSDGLWAELADGYTVDGCISFRGESARELLAMAKLIKTG